MNASSRRHATVWTLAGVLAVAPGLAIATAVFQFMDRHPPRWSVLVLILSAWVLVAVAAGRSIGSRVIDRVGMLRPLAAVAGGSATGWLFARHPIGLAVGPALPAERLMWLLDMEDNARFVGVAREMLEGAPSGGRLAAEFGTGFLSPALLVRSAWSDTGSGDPRLAAIDVVNLSAGLAILVVALIVITVSLTTMAQRETTGHRPLRAAIDAILTATATGVAAWVAVAVPMRSGFLSFIWGVVWLCLAAALVAWIPSSERPAAAVLMLAWLASVLLMIGSWPFLLAGALPALLLVRVPGGHAAGSGLRRPALVLLGTTAVLVVVGWLLWDSQVRSVLGSVGLEALTVEGTVITTDLWLRLLGGAAVIGALLVAASGSEATSPLGRLRSVGTSSAAAAAAVGISLGALHLLARLVSDGETAYAGRKLLHGTVAVAVVVALPAVLAWAAGTRFVVGVPVGAAVVALILGTRSGDIHDVWEAAVHVHVQPHALAVTEALAMTSSELPIRCLPPSGTPATSGARWAAYFCVNWVEDAFNEDRRDGFRMDLLLTEDPTFDALIERMRSERQSDYLFAHLIVAGPGWAHWDGSS